MYFPIPFTRSYTSPVLSKANTRTRTRTRAPYCHHHLSGSADSTEYWTWNGPDHDEEPHFAETDDHTEDCEDCEQESIEQQHGPECIRAFESIPEHYPVALIVTNPDESPRPVNHFSVRPPHVPRFEDSYFETLLDLAGDDSSASSGFGESSSFSTPLSESLSPLLRFDRQALDAYYTVQHLSARDGDSPQSKPIGLGLFDLTRKGDVTRPFDGLGAVHIRSGSEGNEAEVEGPTLSNKFLHDLETFFLVDNLPPPLSKTEGPIIMVEEADSSVVTDVFPQTPKEESPFPSSPRPASQKLSRRIKDALRPRGRPIPPPIDATTSLSTEHTSNGSILPSPSTTSTLSSSLSTTSTVSSSSSSSFIRRTCSAIRSQYNLKALRAENAINAARKMNGTTIITPSPSFRLAQRSTSPSNASPRKVSVSVSMGGYSPSKGMALRSLRTHSSRDLRDLSVLGTISSDLKKRGKVVSSGSESGSLSMGPNESASLALGMATVSSSE